MRNIGRNLVVLVALVGLVGFFGGCASTNEKLMKKMAWKLPKEIQSPVVRPATIPKELCLKVDWAPEIEVENMSNEDLAEAVVEMEKAIVKQFAADGWKIVAESPLKLDVRITYFQKGSTTARWVSTYAASVFTLGEGVAGTTELRLFISLTKEEELILDGNIWMRTSKKGSLSGLGDILETSTKFYTLGMIRQTLAEGVVQVVDHYGGFPPKARNSKK